MVDDADALDGNSIMSQTSIAAAIASRTAEAEKVTATALGHDAIDSFDLWCRAYFETWNRAMDPPRPATLTRFRPMGTK